MAKEVVDLRLSGFRIFDVLLRKNACGSISAGDWDSCGTL